MKILDVYYTIIYYTDYTTQVVLFHHSVYHRIVWRVDEIDVHTTGTKTIVCCRIVEHIHFEWYTILEKLGWWNLLVKCMNNSCEVSSQKLVHLTNLVTIFRQMVLIRKNEKKLQITRSIAQYGFWNQIYWRWVNIKVTIVLLHIFLANPSLVH